MTEKLVTVEEFFKWGVQQGAQNTPLETLKKEFEALEWVAEPTAKKALYAKWRKEALAEVLELKEFQKALFEALEVPAEPLGYSLI